MKAQLAKLQFARGMRFRLTMVNAVFVTGLLLLLGFFFHGLLSAILDDQMRGILDEEWATVKGYLVIHKREPMWMFDRDDQEESFIIERLRRVFLLTDAEGKVMFASPVYEDLGANSPAEIKAAIASREPLWQVRKDSDGEPFQIRAGVFVDDSQQRYFVAIGRSLDANERTLRAFARDYFLLLPVFILSGVLLSWMAAGRALRPVHDLAAAAERVSGSNLSLRIPLYGSGDELDILIQTFNRMVERLENTFQMTRQFSTDVSHELRTPLTAIRGQLEVALFTAQSKEQYREAMLDALEDVERLSHTVRAMLLLSQAESGQLALQKSWIDLADLVTDIVDQFQIPAEESKLEITAEVNRPCLIQLDRVQIERLLSNLLSNAVKYTPMGGQIRVRAKASESQVEIEVSDTGVGIPAGHLPHIFDRFYRVPGETREKHGLGLGLSFVAWIVKAHGGSIDVASEHGEGTRFLITLPAAPQTARVVMTAAAEPTAAASEKAGELAD